MSRQSRKTFVLFALVVCVFALMAIACDDDDGTPITIRSLGNETIEIGQEIADSLTIPQSLAPFEGQHGVGICRSTGLNCR